MALSGMQLCLVNNDPISTLLITPDGEALFSIETPSVHLPPNLNANPNQNSTSNANNDSTSQISGAPSSSASTPRQRSAITTVKRLERYHRSTGHTETEIGTIEFKGLVMGTHLQLCENNMHLDIPPHQRRSQRRIESPPKDDEEEEGEEETENSWAFKGPDSRRYKWQLFVHSPVLLLDDQTFTPLARYRRAKLGIVSRSRRAFLEILPAGINLIDFIVVTFVGFMRQRLLSDVSASTPSPTPSFAPSPSTAQDAPTPVPNPNPIPKPVTTPLTAKGAAIPKDPSSAIPRPVSTKVPS